MDILDPARKRRTLNRVGMVLTCVLAAAVMLPITALSPWDASESNTSPLMTQGSAQGFAFFDNTDAVTNFSEEPTWPATISDERVLKLDRTTAAADTSEEQRRARKMAIRALRKSLADENAEVRRHAVITLNEMNDVGALEALAKLAEDDPDAEVRRFAIIALSELDENKAIETFIAALDDRDREVRQYAAIALADIDNRRAVDALIEMLDDRDPEIRRYALVGIIDNGDARTNQSFG